VHGLAWAEERLNYEAWYRYYQNQDYRRAADAYQVVLLLNPNSESASYWLAEAQKNIR
jgi:TolA-binding protein